MCQSRAYTGFISAVFEFMYMYPNQNEGLFLVAFYFVSNFMVIGLVRLTYFCDFRVWAGVLSAARHPRLRLSAARPQRLAVFECLLSSATFRSSSEVPSV